MKRIFTIVGPESSGTRLSTNIFIKSGIIEVGKDTDKAIDIFSLKHYRDILDNNQDTVLRKSIPHGKKPVMMDIPQFSRICDLYGVIPYMVIPIRIYKCLIQSKRKRGRQPTTKTNQEIYNIINDEYSFIFKGISNMNFYLLSTSSLMTDSNRELESLSEWTGLNLNTNVVKEMISDADGKWFA